MDELEDSISEYSSLDKRVVRRAIDAVTMQLEEGIHLNNVAKLFVPLLLSLGNGLVLRPVSSLARNPFLTTLALQERRNPATIDEVSKLRENWFRSELYAMFQGSRYQRVEGSIKIRTNGRITTDIDAAIFDNLTGELALFQIKWQDYFTNDVRQLRSRASNLARELDVWAEKVQQWIVMSGKDEILRALRLKRNKGKSIGSVYLFGLSRHYARVEVFDFATTNEWLVVTSWPKFVRTRIEMGPADRVFHRIFHTLRSNMGEPIPPITPIPSTIKVSEKTICFDDLWCVCEDEDSSELNIHNRESEVMDCPWIDVVDISGG